MAVGGGMHFQLRHKAESISSLSGVVWKVKLVLHPLHPELRVESLGNLHPFPLPGPGGSETCG